MPFLTQEKRAFTRENVEALLPGQMGVYGLFRSDDAPVCIGKGDIRERLLAHLNGDSECIRQHSPAYWLDEIIENEWDATSRMRQLIVDYEPLCR